MKEGRIRRRKISREAFDFCETEFGEEKEERKPIGDARYFLLVCFFAPDRL
jgi:hypothetical protein